MAAIQGFAAEDAFVERFEARNRDWLRTGMRLALIRSIALPLLVLAGGVAMFVLIAVGGPMVLDGTLTVGQLAAFTALLTVFLPPLRSMGWMMSVVQRGRAALERIFELMDAPVERPEGAEGRVLEVGHGPEIELKDLRFAYPDEPDRLVLEGLTVTIPAGAVVGLFGRTGSGKSTLLRLLARIYNPPRGSMFIDGADLTTLDLESWRRRLAVVPQRPFLFSDAIESNVALEEDPDDRLVRRAIGMHHAFRRPATAGSAGPGSVSRWRSLDSRRRAVGGRSLHRGSTCRDRSGACAAPGGADGDHFQPPIVGPTPLRSGAGSRWRPSG
jgi:ATP-binding cassette subfamily B protein